MTPTATALRPPDTAAGVRLHQLLDAELGFDPVARGGFINHTPMALVAAWRLGADTEELERWFDDDTSPPQAFLVAREVPQVVIDRRAAVERVGLDASIRAAGPRLVDSPVSQFFHAPIRLELALDAGHAGQVANALQNWEDHPTVLGPVPTGRGSRDLRDVARELAATPGISGAGLRETVVTERFAAALSEVDLGAGDLIDAVADVALWAHLGTDSFTSLHQVTGARAVRVVSGVLVPADHLRMVAAMALALVASTTSAGDPLPSDGEIDDLRHRHAPDWHDIAAAARATGDHHVVKVTYALLHEHEVSGDPLRQWVAARQVGLVA